MDDWPIRAITRVRFEEILRVAARPAGTYTLERTHAALVDLARFLEEVAGETLRPDSRSSAVWPAAKLPRQ